MNATEYMQIRHEEAYLHLPDYYDLAHIDRVRLVRYNRAMLIAGRTAVLLRRDLMAVPDPAANPRIEQEPQSFPDLNYE